MVFILTTEGCTERSLQKIACYSIVCNNEIYKQCKSQLLLFITSQIVYLYIGI